MTDLAFSIPAWVHVPGHHVSPLELTPPLYRTKIRPSYLIRLALSLGLRILVRDVVDPGLILLTCFLTAEPIAFVPTPETKTSVPCLEARNDLTSDYHHCKGVHIYGLH